MKSESTKMMLRHICLISCFLLISYGQTAELQPDEIKELNDINQNASTSVKMSITSHTSSDKLNLDSFETSHKIHEDMEFETAHKINKDHQPLSTSESLMQMQQTQNLLATKERPELNPVLSALINEDVMKSIESKRAVEQHEQHLTTPIIITTTENPIEESATLDNVPILTTETMPTKKSHSSSSHEEDHIGLIDQSIMLEEAGSENSPKSRIQVKKGPKGEDYEYEYVYYYYDDDEKNENEKEGQASDTKEKSSSSNSEVTSRPKEATSRGKSRYTNIERSTTSVPENEIVSKAKGRSSIPVTEDVDEGRLPANTRFPPRNKNTDVTPTPSMDSDSNEKTEKSEKSRKIGVKRPSLELVDSETFNTDEKQAKGNRNLDAESTKTAQQTEAENEVKLLDKQSSKDSDEAEEPNSTDTDEIENTTPLMEKVAFDLYAILANENLNLDMTTDGTEDMTTDIPDTTDAEDLTTISSELETSSTVTTTTTTEPTTTTTTTTTTTPAPLPSSRRGLGTVGRNRFRLKSGASTSPQASTTESPASEATTKGKNRFQRPSFGGRTSKPSSTSAPAKEDTVEKEEAKPVSSSSSSVRGRTRNRFNLRGSSTTTEKNTDDANSVEEQVSSTSARTLRARPTLNIRGRGRPSPSTTTTTSNPESNDTGNSEEKTEEKSPSSLLPTRPSRFNLNRPGSAAGGNKLLPRGRINTLRTTAVPSTAETESEDEEKKDGDAKERGEASGETASENGDDKTSESTTQAAGGLNRLRNRPRIQINTKTDKPKPQPNAVNRKVNPLLARRKLGLGSSTTEASVGEDENEDQDAEKEDKKEDTTEIKDEDKEETTEAVEVSSEPPRGLGLLGNRRRLPLRKPGTIL